VGENVDRALSMFSVDMDEFRMLQSASIDGASSTTSRSTESADDKSSSKEAGTSGRRHHMTLLESGMHSLSDDSDTETAIRKGSADAVIERDSTQCSTFVPGSLISTSLDPAAWSMKSPRKMSEFLTHPESEHQCMYNSLDENDPRNTNSDTPLFDSALLASASTVTGAGAGALPLDNGALGALGATDAHTLAAIESAAEIVLLLQVCKQNTENGRRNIDDLLTAIVDDNIEMMHSAATSIIAAFSEV
jgi:hypothetical protein